MAETPDQDQPGCFAASVQVPHYLHIDLPNVDQEDVCLTINTCLIQLTTQHWSLMSDGLVSCAMVTMLANSCMDIVQTFTEEILDVVMPQFYRYMRTYGTISPSILSLTEDRIHTYLGDSIEQALAKALKTQVHHFVATREFTQSLLRHISKQVNSVLALSTQTHALESRLPVLFVSGCVASIGDFTDMVRQFATILKGALEAKQEAQMMIGYERCQAASYGPSREVESPAFLLNSRGDLKTLVKKYISRMVKVLKSAQMPNCEMSTRDHMDVCIKVGTNIQILTREGRQSDRRSTAMFSSCDFDAIPGAVPDSDDTQSHTESCPLSSVTVITAAEDRFRGVSPNAMESIKEIADELVQAFLEEYLQGEEQEGSCQKAARGGPEVVNNVKLRELTDRVFDVVMSGHDYQIPSVPAGTRMSDTVTYRKLRGEEIIDQGILAHTLYLRTEEVVTRCAVQVLLWSELHQDWSDHATLIPLVGLSDDLDFVSLNEAGDQLEAVNASPPPPHAMYSVSMQDSYTTYDAIHEPLHIPPSEMKVYLVRGSLLTLLVGEMLTIIGITDIEFIMEIVNNVITQCEAVENSLYDHFYASLMGRSYKDISQDAVSDLLLMFGSVEYLQEAVRLGDPIFEEALMRALRKQWRIPTSPMPQGNTANKTTCFFKKLKKLCCKKKKASKTTPFILEQ